MKKHIISCELSNGLESFWNSGRTILDCFYFMDETIWEKGETFLTKTWHESWNELIMVALQVVNRTVATITDIRFEFDHKILHNLYKTENSLRDCHLMPFGGSKWTRLYLRKDTIPYQRLMTMKLLFHRTTMAKEDQMYEDELKLTFSEADAGEVTKLFTYQVEWQKPITSANHRIDFQIEVTVLNNAEFANICAAETLFKMSEKLVEVGNREDAVRAFKTAKSIAEETPGVGGKNEEQANEHLDAICYMELAKEHMALYFKADEEQEEVEAELELRKAIQYSTIAHSIDPNDEKIKDLKDFIFDVYVSASQFEDGRIDQGNAILLELLTHFEYAIYKTDHAIEKYTAVTNRLKKWDVKSFNLKDIPEDCFEKYREKLQFAHHYLALLEELYTEQKNENSKSL